MKCCALDKQCISCQTRNMLCKSCLTSVYSAFEAATSLTSTIFLSIDQKIKFIFQRQCHLEKYIKYLDNVLCPLFY